MADPLRLPLYAPLTSRDSSLDKDSLATNVFYDSVEGSSYATKRPGIETLITGSGQGQGIYFFDGEVFSWETSPYTWLAATFRGESIVAATTSLTGNVGLSAYSSNSGRSWAEGSYAATSFGNCLITSDGTSYTLHASGSFYQSTDGINWTFTASVNLQSFPSLTWGNGLYVALTGSPTFYTSTDGITWTSRSDNDVNGTGDGQSLAFGNGTYVALRDSFGTPTRAVYSTDGISWTVTVMSPTFQNNAPQAITFGDGKFVAVSGGQVTGSTTGYYSTNGITWTLTTLPIAQSWVSVAWNGSVFIAVGSSNLYAISSDGLTWNLGEIPFLDRLNLVIANPTTGVIVAFSDLSSKGFAKSSDNGANWTYGNLPSADTTTGIITTL